MLVNFVIFLALFTNKIEFSLSLNVENKIFVIIPDLKENIILERSE